MLVALHSVKCVIVRIFHTVIEQSVEKQLQNKLYQSCKIVMIWTCQLCASNFLCSLSLR